MLTLLLITCSFSLLTQQKICGEKLMKKTTLIIQLRKAITVQLTSHLYFKDLIFLLNPSLPIHKCTLNKPIIKHLQNFMSQCSASIDS